MAINKEKIAASAQKHLKKGNYDKAIKEYQKIVKADPSEMRYWKRIGDLQVRAGDKAGAIETYLKISDDFLSKGFHHKALAILRQIQALDSTIEDVYTKLARVYIATDFIGDALHSLEQLVAIYEKTNKQEEMLATLSEMADIDPSKVVHRVHYAETLSRLNKKREAAHEFRSVADYLKGEKNDKDYIKVAERLLFHDPDDKEVLRELAETYIRQKNPQKILKRLLEIYQSYPGDLDNLHILARVFLSMGKNKKAIQVYKEMARLYVEQDKRQQSNTIFERILEIDPQDRDALKGLGRLKERRPAPKPHKAKPAVEEVEPNADDLVMVEEVEELEVEELIEVQEDEEDLKTIEESEAFFRYGLVDKALGNLDKVSHQDHPRLLTLKKEIYIKKSRKTDALEVMSQLAEHYSNDEPERAVDLAQEALQLQSSVDWADKLLSEMGSSMPNLKPLTTQEIAAVLELDDALDIMDELDDADAVLDVASLSTTGELEVINQKVHSEEEIDKALSEKESAQGITPDDEGFETDLQEMLASLQGLTDSAPPGLSKENDLILDTSALPPVPQGEYKADLTLGHDELAELQEASQSFIRINELSKDDIDINELASKDKKDPGLPNAEDFIAFNLDDLDASENTPIDDSQPGAQDEEDDFLLNLDDALNGIPSAEGVSSEQAKSESKGSDFAPEATMDNYEQLMSFDEQMKSELYYDESFDEESSSSTNDSDSAEDSGSEDELPADVTDTFEEVEFFLEMALYQEALDSLMDLYDRFPLPQVKEMIGRVAGEGELPNPLEPKSEDEEESQDLLDEPTPVAQIYDPTFESNPDTEDTAVTSHEDLLKEQPEEDLSPSPAEGMFEDLSLGDGEDNLDLDFDEEEVTSLQAIDFMAGFNEQEGPSSDDGVRIATEQPIGDAGTHLDLGLAYMEMGLYKQAIEEFKQAIEEPVTEVQARLLSGKCYLEMGDSISAANEMKRTLHREDLKASEEMDLYFELGRVYESLKDLPEALYYYKKVQRRDDNYRGVAEIVSRLEA